MQLLTLAAAEKNLTVRLVPRQADRMEQIRTRAGAVDPPHCQSCRVHHKTLPSVMEYLGHQVFQRKGPPKSLVRQNAWFCPVCGEVSAERGIKVPVTPDTVLLYDPPRCVGWGERRDPRPAPMRKVKSNVAHFGHRFDEYKCSTCSIRARVLLRNRKVPFLIDRGHRVEEGVLYHDQRMDQQSYRRSCEGPPILSGKLFMLNDELTIVSICSGCLAVSYVPNALELLERRYGSVDNQ